MIFPRSVLFPLCVAAMAISSAHASDAAIDTSFGANPAGWRRAYVVAGGTTDERIVASARTPDGGYLLAGSRAGGAAGVSIFLAKFRPDGTYDAAFGGTAATGNAGVGRVLKDAYLSSVADMTVDTQGRVIVVGSTPGALGQPDFGVVRFLPNGMDDVSFAGDGGTSVAFDGDAANSRVKDIPNSVATLPDGSIFVAGVVEDRPYTGIAITVVGVAKLKPDGSPDTVFGFGTGRSVYCMGDCVDVTSVARMIYDAPRNRLLIGGTYNTGPQDFDWFLRTVDVTTETSGGTTYNMDFAGPSGYQLAYMTNVAVQPDGKVLLTGWVNYASLAARPVVLRTNAVNVLEDLFAFGNTQYRGIYVGNVDTVVYNDVAIDSLGRILLAGAAGIPALGEVERLTSAGVPDTSFNDGSSVAQYGAPTSGSPDLAYSTSFKRMFLDGDRPVLAGEAPDSTSANTDYDLIVTRLKSDVIFANGFD